jgi:serine/threonine-protein kinase RsbW
MEKKRPFPPKNPHHHPTLSQRLTHIAGIMYHPHTVAMDNEAERVFHQVTLGDLSQIRQYVRETAVSYCGESAAIDELVTAMNEAVSNIIRHGYKHEPGDIEMTIACSGTIVQIMLRDYALHFDPTQAASPDTTLPLAERPFGGLGVHMMREFCDELIYRRTKNDENELILLKRVDQRPSGF